MPPDTPATWLENAERLSKTLSIAAIPVVLAVGGWLIQRQLQDQTVRRDYVQLAVSILQNPDSSKISPEIREWAVDLLNENSPTPLNQEAVQRLKSGAVTLSGFNFVPSSALTPGLQRNLETSLQGFQSYLGKLGFTVRSDMISVKITPGTGVKGNVAIWDPTTRSIEVASAFASDEPSVLRQFAHEVLIPKTVDSPAYYAIESGLASYFPCSFADHPVIGEKASDAGKALLPPWDLRNKRRFQEIRLNDWVSVQHDGSDIWGGALWQLRELMGQQEADPLIAKAWQTFSFPKKGDTFQAFANALVEGSQQVEAGKYSGRVQEMLNERGLRF